MKARAALDSATKAGMFSCFVRGIPAPQGSKTPFVRKDGTPGLRDDNKSLAGWRTAVGFVLQNEWKDDVLQGSVGVALNFQLLRPPSVSAKRRPLPTVKPDIDKLARACLDAMTGIVFRDDAQVVMLHATKCYAKQSGVAITVKPQQ